MQNDFKNALCGIKEVPGCSIKFASPVYLNPRSGPICATLQRRERDRGGQSREREENIEEGRDTSRERKEFDLIDWARSFLSPWRVGRNVGLNPRFPVASAKPSW